MVSKRDAHFRIELDELAEPRREPVHADARRGGDAQIAVRPLAAVGELGARRLELHEHVVRGAEQQIALLGQDQAARMAVKQRDRELLLERAHLARHRRLRQPELFAGMGETSRLGGGVKDLELIPVHDRSSGRGGENHSAAMRGSASPCAARNFSASSAAMQPSPAAVTACR